MPISRRAEGRDTPVTENVQSLEEFRKKREKEHQLRDDAMRDLVDLGEREIHATSDLGIWARAKNSFSKEIFMEPEELVSSRGLTVADERDQAVEWLNKGSNERLKRLKAEGRTPEKIKQELLELFREMTAVYRTVFAISYDEWRIFLSKTYMKENELLTDENTPESDKSYILFAGVPPEGINKELHMKWLVEWWNKSKELFNALTQLGTAYDEVSTSTLNFVRKLAAREIEEIENTYGSESTLSMLIQKKRFEMILKLLDRGNISREQWSEFIERGEF